MLGLVDDVHAQLVAEVVEAGVVGVVAAADGVEVELLHQGDVLEVERGGDGLAVDVAVLVAVGALDEDGFAV